MLLEKFITLLGLWEELFPQKRTWVRAVQLGLGLLCGLGRRTLTRSIFFRGKEQEDWSGDYKVFSRSPWKSEPLFAPIFDQAIPAFCSGGPIAIGLDDTALPRTGKKIPGAFRQRDPMSPPFHTNLIWGQRFLQASVLVPLYEHDQQSSPRALPVRFKEAPVPKKPGPKASEELHKEYRQLRKQKNLSSYFVQTVHELRTRLDEHGYQDRLLLAVGDGSFCNKRTFTATYDRTVLLTRCRKDLSLRPSGEQTAKAFQPLEVLKDDNIPWQSARIFYAGDWREIQYKELKNIIWRRAGKDRRLRLLVIKPLPYQKTKNGPKQFREEAFLLCTDPDGLSAQVLLQKYFDRWEIEVNHRDEKTVLGVGQAQVWNEHSVEKVPEFLVALYSFLLLAGLQAYGAKRSAQCQALPKWRTDAKRASCLDLLTLLRAQLETRKDRQINLPRANYATMVLTAAA